MNGYYLYLIQSERNMDYDDRVDAVIVSVIIIATK